MFIYFFGGTSPSLSASHSGPLDYYPKTMANKFLGENMNGNDAYLAIRFEGPEVKPGRMRLDDFLQAASEFSACAKRVALALQNTPSAVPGRRPTDLSEALSLDIVGFIHGSPAAIVLLQRSEDQMLMQNADFGETAYKALLEGIESVSGDTTALPPGFDLGVLMKLRDFGRLFSKGVSRVEFTLNHHSHAIKGIYDQPRQDRVCQRIAQPQPQQQTLQGRLLMADFKETGRQLRVHPSVGQPILCRFPESLSSEVEKCIRQFVRVTGQMAYHPGGEPRLLEIADIEPVDEPAGTFTTQSSTWTYGFWESPSAEEYARRQGIEPVRNIATLYGPGESQDWQGFDEALERWHAETPVS